MKIVLDSGEQVEVPTEVFRKILGMAQFALHNIKKAEGKEFPKSEQTALDFTFKLQLKDSNLI